MHRLTLLRHAKSSWDDPSLDDFHRPLNGRGRRNAPEMGRRLRDSSQTPDLLISSPATRAITTARMAAREMAYPEARIVEERGLYHAGAGEILRIVQSLETLARHVMLVGHNPGFTDLANRLSAVRIDNMPTASLFCVDFEIEQWSDAAAGEARFVYFDFPKNDRGQPYTAADF
jgi:phosphohistidine phosphatase